MQEANRFPMDFDALRKGDIIPAEVIERYRVHNGIGLFEFAAMQLKAEIRREIAIRQNMHVVIRHERDTLVILNDAEASAYCAEEFHRDLRRAMQHHLDQLRVDQSQLTTDEKSEHERRVINNSKYFQAIALAGSRHRRGLSAQRRLGMTIAKEEGVSDVSETSGQDRGNLSNDHAQRSAGGSAEPDRPSDKGIDEHPEQKADGSNH